jgi:flagellar basal body-associated protein FliL
MSKASSQDNFVAYVSAAVVICLTAIFLFAWNHIRAKGHDVQAVVAYAQFGPFQVENQNLSIEAKLAVQTSVEDASWPEANRKNLNAVFQRLLSEADMKAIKTPNGLRLLQDALTKGSNAAFHANYVQSVLLTDFVFEGTDQ